MFLFNFHYFKILYFSCFSLFCQCSPGSPPQYPFVSYILSFVPLSQMETGAAEDIDTFLTSRDVNSRVCVCVCVCARASRHARQRVRACACA